MSEIAEDVAEAKANVPVGFSADYLNLPGNWRTDR